MSNTKWYEPRDLNEAQRMASIMHSSGLTGLKSPEEVFAVAAAGAAAGFDFSTSLRVFQVIKGRLTLSAGGAAAAAMAHPDCESFRLAELTLERCVFEVKRAGSDTVVVEYTMAEAKSAGLVRSGPWTKFPKAMLAARCKSRAARLVFPDALAGVAIRGVDGELDGDLEVEAPTPAAASPASKNAAKSKVAERRMYRLEEMETLQSSLSLLEGWKHAAGAAKEWLSRHGFWPSEGAAASAIWKHLESVDDKTPDAVFEAVAKAVIEKHGPPADAEKTAA